MPVKKKKSKSYTSNKDSGFNSVQISQGGSVGIAQLKSGKDKLAIETASSTASDEKQSSSSKIYVPTGSVTTKNSSNRRFNTRVGSLNTSMNNNANLPPAGG